MSDGPLNETPLPDPPREEEVCRLDASVIDAANADADEVCRLDAAGADAAPEPGGRQGGSLDRWTTRLAALIYLGLSLVATLLFITATTLRGGYPAVARYGGAAWVFLLVMIVLMPLVIPRVRRWRSRG